MALIYGMAKANFALKDFADIGNDSVSDAIGVFFDESIPVTVGAKNISNRCSSDDFHRPSSQSQVFGSSKDLPRLGRRP